MKNQFAFRKETKDDFNELFEVNRLAFGQDNEIHLVWALRNNPKVFVLGLYILEIKDDGSHLTYADYDYSQVANTYYFEKKGTLHDVKEVFFIVSAQTASAAELLINNLKPYLPVKLIGQKTYGKPVGYFAINMGNYAIYLSSFLAFNALNQGSYYEGIDVDFPYTDDVTTDFGSTEDPAIQLVINQLTADQSLQITKKSTHNRLLKTSIEERMINPIEKPYFHGMIESDGKLK